DTLRRYTAGPRHKIAKTTPCKVEGAPVRSTRAACVRGTKWSVVTAQPNLILPWHRAVRTGAPTFRSREECPHSALAVPPQPATEPTTHSRQKFFGPMSACREARRPWAETELT